MGVVGERGSLVSSVGRENSSMDRVGEVQRVVLLEGIVVARNFKRVEGHRLIIRVMVTNILKSRVGILIAWMDRKQGNCRQMTKLGNSNQRRNSSNNIKRTNLIAYGTSLLRQLLSSCRSTPARATPCWPSRTSPAAHVVPCPSLMSAFKYVFSHST